MEMTSTKHLGSDILSDPKHPYFKYLMKHVKRLYALKDSEEFQKLELSEQLMQVWSFKFDDDLSNGRVLNLISFIICNTLHPISQFHNQDEDPRDRLAVYRTPGLIAILASAFDAFSRDIVLLLQELNNRTGKPLI